jgi:hypothetical protein
MIFGKQSVLFSVFSFYRCLYCCLKIVRVLGGCWFVSVCACFFCVDLCVCVSIYRGGLYVREQKQTLGLTFKSASQ